MATPPGGTAIDPAIVAALTRAGGDAGADWFGPGKPLDPVAPESVQGRAFDFPFAVNIGIRPRGEQGESGLDFPTLRRLADPALGGLDLVRLAIETRKDQMSAQKWRIKARDEDEDAGERGKEIEELLRKPDGIHPFRVWQRMLIEDGLVLDAPVIYRRPTAKGFLLPEVIDGATIVKKVGADGRTPLPPETAYQQILKGVPAADYTLEEMLYGARNLRSHRIYGMSPVEQVVNIIGIALRRQLSTLQYYTEGNVPEALLGVPPEWTPDQIKQFQTWWDLLMEGNTAQRRHMKFVPGGMTPYPTRDPTLKDQFDEWLARIVCYAFSLSPQALVQQMNRATAETAQSSAASEGLEPLKLWFKDVMDDVVATCYGAPELEFAWADEEIPDPLVKAQVYGLLVDKGILTDDEARDEGYGREPLTQEQRDVINPPPPPMMGPDGKPMPPGANGKPARPGGPRGGEGRSAASGAPPRPADDDASAEKVAGLVRRALANDIRRGRVWTRYP